MYLEYNMQIFLLQNKESKSIVLKFLINVVKRKAMDQFKDVITKKRFF